MKLFYENLFDILMLFRSVVRIVSLGALVVGAVYLFLGFSKGEPFYIKILCIIAMVQFFFVRSLYDRLINWVAARADMTVFLSH